MHLFRGSKLVPVWLDHAPSFTLHPRLLRVSRPKDPSSGLTPMVGRRTQERRNIRLTQRPLKKTITSSLDSIEGFLRDKSNAAFILKVCWYPFRSACITDIDTVACSLTSV